MRTSRNLFFQSFLGSQLRKIIFIIILILISTLLITTQADKSKAFKSFKSSSINIVYFVSSIVTTPVELLGKGISKISEQKIEVKYFNIIYEAIEHIEKRLSGLLEPDVKEISLGSAEVQKIFKVSKFGQIAGSKVIEGEIQNKSKARIVRDGAVVYDGEIMSIFREKNAVKEVKNGLECGISLRDFIDFKEKDIIESYQIEKIERTL